MKLLFRGIATAGLIATTLAGSWLAQGGKLLALPKDVILQKLIQIPVFTVVNSKGSPLLRVVQEAEGNKTKKVAGVFISKADANKFVQEIKQENPELGEIEVVAVSLGEIYDWAQANANKPDGINFAYVPMAKEVKEAQKILTKNNQEYKGGVPLFVAWVKKGQEQGYLVMKNEDNDQEVIPFFFEEAQVQKLVDDYKKEKPDSSVSITIEVVPFEMVLAILEQKEDEWLKKIVIVPSKESLDFISTQGKNQQQ